MARLKAATSENTINNERFTNLYIVQSNAITTLQSAGEQNWTELNFDEIVFQSSSSQSTWNKTNLKYACTGKTDTSHMVKGRRNR